MMTKPNRQKFAPKKNPQAVISSDSKKIKRQSRDKPPKQDVQATSITVVKDYEFIREPGSILGLRNPANQELVELTVPYRFLAPKLYSLKREYSKRQEEPDEIYKNCPVCDKEFRPVNELRRHFLRKHCSG